ncbi:photosystem I P700 chlorophyll A apoprotein [Artemisia annua]|uniref:Photosystem I P700 chlorophyll A apoprotein n=1 Tax=Artemisia annua TaxID=35608 RepID=A0A2U1N2R9_ARTAN|nr:photosystem I P700 chlorophyll A apoprotein [Artemisia annua]
MVHLLMGERRGLNPHVVDSQSTALIHLATFTLTLAQVSVSIYNHNLSEGRSIWFSGWLNTISENSNSIFLTTIGLGDLLVHHAIALGLHATTLILVKDALDRDGTTKAAPSVSRTVKRLEAITY